MVMRRATADVPWSTADFARRIDAADRLLVSAVEAVESFYVGGEVSAPSRFLRDTLDEPEVVSFSTGGGAVAADLWEVGKQVPYLSAVLGKDLFLQLEEDRDEASTWLASAEQRMAFSGTFGKLNPYTTAVACDQILRMNPEAARAMAYGAAVLDAYRRGWPVLEGVDHQHPYIASRVFRTGEALARTDLPAKIAAADADAVVEDANIAEADAVREAIHSLQEASFDLAEARERYLKSAESYLWQQHGFATSSSSPPPNVLSYDPVGTCFALDILLGASAASGSEADSVRELAEYEDAIRLSVRHVLLGMSPTGSLAYGLPFAYDAKGMGAFATSISGLNALASVLSSLLTQSRRSSYRNARFIEGLLVENSEPVDKLFALPDTIEGSKRRISHLGRYFAGWATDRAASFTRIESWVSMDVLRFAIYLRLLVQEAAQFQVVQKYGAKLVSSAPRWPYDPSSTTYEPLHGVQFLQDPDQLSDTQEPTQSWRRRSPIPFLHETLRHLMPFGAEAWETERASFLLFGPPGTSKSTVAKSLAQRLNWHFLELTPSNFVEEGLEMIESRSSEIFGELSFLRETVVLFDELDSLLTDRERLDPSSILNFTVPAMLPKLQRLTEIAKRQRLVLIFATNFFDRLDPAMARRGRIDERLLVLPPAASARRTMLAEKLTGNALEEGVESTRLAGYEDLKRYRDDLELSHQSRRNVAGITPALYFSRIPREDRRARDIRSTERLAIEVAEVAGRLLDEPRHLDADARRGEVAERLAGLGERLSDADQIEWRDLCGEVKEALSIAVV